MLPYVVIDASVAGAWLFAEPYSSQAQVVLDAITARRVIAIAPDRFKEEVLRICQKKTLPPPHGTGVPISEAFDSFVDAVTLPMTFMPSDELHEQAWQLAYHSHMTTHDALYVALAQNWTAELWTLDVGLVSAAQSILSAFDLRLTAFPY